MGTPYLDALVYQLWLVPEVANLRTMQFGVLAVANAESHRLSLNPLDARTAQQLMGLQRALERTVTRITGGPEAVQRGIAAIEAALTPDVIDALCHELVLPYIQGFGQRSVSVVQLREMLCRLVIARIVNESEAYEQALESLRAALR